MLVLLPPSEGKTLPSETVDFNADAIAPFSTQLADARQSVLDCLIETSARRDALEILKVGKTIADEVEANKHLRSAQAGPAWQVYSGVLYEAGRFGEIGAQYTASPDFEIWVQSALFGVVDLACPIPPYRLSMDTKLPGLGNLAPWWKKRLEPLMEQRAHHRVVVDVRSGAYQKAWPGASAECDLIRVNAVRERGGKRTVVSHNAKKYRGILAGALLEHASEADGSIDFVLDTARSLTGADLTGIEVRQRRDHLELVIVTN